ncbi:MAG: FtsB family cell division protein [Acidobacteriota bacterium]
MVDFNRQQLKNRPVSAGDQTTYSEMARWIFFGGLFIGLILVYAWLHMEMLDISYQMEQIKRENAQLRELNSALRAEYSSLLNPQKIDEEARRLGLIHSNREEVMILQAHAPGAVPPQNVVAEALKKVNLLE